jgi:hypothetical protein
MKKIRLSQKGLLREKNDFFKHFWLKIIFSAYRKTAETDDILKDHKPAEDKSKTRRIRCPLCEWQPKKSSRWMCWDCDYPEYFYGGCGTNWNTFETGGVCPGCNHRWIWTTCFRCGEWSRHEDWYEKKD